MGDDGLNVHSFYFTVARVVNASTLQIALFKSWPATLQVGVGTSLTFAHLATPFTAYTTAPVMWLTRFMSSVSARTSAAR